MEAIDGRSVRGNSRKTPTTISRTPPCFRVALLSWLCSPWWPRCARSCFGTVWATHAATLLAWAPSRRRLRSLSPAFTSPACALVRGVFFVVVLSSFVCFPLIFATQPRCARDSFLTGVLVSHLSRRELGGSIVQDELEGFIGNVNNQIASVCAKVRHSFSTLLSESLLA